MVDKKIEWHKVADSIDAIHWQPNNMALAEVGGKTITLVKLDGEIKACAHKCPHASGVLADGFIDALGQLTCPLHRYKFNLNNGHNITGEGYYLKVYAVEKREAGIFIGFEKSRWSF